VFSYWEPAPPYLGTLGARCLFEIGLVVVLAVVVLAVVALVVVLVLLE
jgi:hypothetical protein